MTAPADVRPDQRGTRSRQVRDNSRRFEALVDECELELRRGRPEQAAARAQLAATFAWFNHPGMFTSRRLERLLVRIGAGLVAEDPDDALPQTGGLLHVATRLHQTGGHTQMIANWVATDTQHAHRVCLTHQGGVEVPGKVRTALGEGALTELDGLVDGFLDRARLLRRLARSADVVVLHVHPNDVVASIALADPTLRRPVLLVNHADHVFWVGTSVATTVVNLRESGRQLTIERRDVPAERNDVLIRPLLLPDRRHDRAEARRLLGLPVDRVLLVTAAAASKYEPVDGIGFLDLLEPLLASRPRAYLVAAGPSPEGRWRTLEESGRGRALGLLPDALPLLEAADVYLDSFPFSSLTSLLEAGCMGTPVITVRPPADGADVLGADTPELDDHLLVAHDAGELRATLDVLVGDAEHRTGLGAATAAAIHGAHAEGEWARQVRRICEPGAVGPFPPQAGPDDVQTGKLDERVALVQERTGIGQGLTGARVLMSGYLPARERLRTAIALLRDGSRPGRSILMSATWIRRLRRARDRSAAWRQQRTGPT